MPGCTNTMDTRPSTSMAYIACESKLSCEGIQCIRAQETGWQSGVRSCIMPGIQRYLVQELSIGTEDISVPGGQHGGWHLCYGAHRSTVQISNSGTSLQTSTSACLYKYYVNKYKLSTSITHVICESKLRSVINAHETGWQSGELSCILLGLPTHLMQELDVGTVTSFGHRILWLAQHGFPNLHNCCILIML